MSEGKSLQDVVREALSVKTDGNDADQEEADAAPEEVKASLLNTMKALSDDISWNSDSSDSKCLTGKASVLMILLQAYERFQEDTEYSKQLGEIISKDEEIIKQMNESIERQKKSRWLDNLLMAMAIAACILAVIFLLIKII